MIFGPMAAWISASPAISVAAAAALAYAVPGAVRRSRGRSVRHLTALLQESARRGRLMPTFPLNSRSGDINRLAAALNGAGQSMERMENALDCAYLEFVETMARTLDARDPYTAGHSIRVGAYAHAIALAMGIPATEAETIRLASELHDIGKIGLPDSILQKADGLTSEEFGLIKLHPQMGRKILERIGRFGALLSVVELHHENFDGTGYPYRLAGEQIPLHARIVHVADAFDAMTTNRSYRGALPPEAAADELRSNAGAMFDPAVVDAFLNLIGDGRHHEILAAGGELIDSQAVSRRAERHISRPSIVGQA